MQFERPVGYFGLNKHNFAKTEIDIVVFDPDKTEKYAIELKFPRNGRYPEGMFDSCTDICFLEQLRQSGFKQCCFIMVADDALFYKRGRTQEGIYRYFRDGEPIHGRIQKPTGKRDHEFQITGSYLIHWNQVHSDTYFASVTI